MSKARGPGPEENQNFNSDDMPALRFLNADDEKFRLELKMRRSLGIIARVALVFSRRGLDIAQFRLDETHSYETVLVALEFRGNCEQLRAVTGDLSKLIEFESLRNLPAPALNPLNRLNHSLPSLTQMQAAITC